MTLGWVPFLDPIPAVFDWWYLLLVPLSFGISVIYKAIRLPVLDGFWRQVVIMTIQIVVAIGALAVMLGLFVELAIPALGR